MAARDLIEEAQRLAKPSLLLSETPSTNAAVAWWGGFGPLVPRARPDDEHRISVDCGWLAAHGYPLQGVLTLYTVAPRWKWETPIHVEHDAAATLVAVPGAVPLHAREALSLPPLEALCLYGGPRVEAWLAAARLQRSDYEEAARLDAGRAYQDYYQEHCPLYTGDADAVLGGWHMRWPDDDFYLPAEMRLLLWTLKDAEPWVEIFWRAGNLIPRERTT